jgi:RNA polymerase sigma-70 factor (ECF subfamily)
MRCTYLVLNELPADERIAFALRFIDGMELVELAEACCTSVATVRRRLRRAEERFVRKARRYPVLSARIEGGSRWSP